MNWRTTFIATTLGLLCLVVAVPANDAAAQQKQVVTYKAPAENSKYTEQHAMDIGDVPGHQLRIYELYRTFPTNAPMINGLKLKETWTRATSDYVDGNGPNAGYSVFVLENGDKFFVRLSTLTQSAGSGKLTSVTVGSIIGGTGKLTGIHGTLRTSTTADPKANFNDGQSEIEYWMEK
jgi:hypothetical protein